MDGRRDPAGAVVLLGVGRDDDPFDADYLAEKISGLHLCDDAGRMNLAHRNSGWSRIGRQPVHAPGDCRRVAVELQRCRRAELAEHLYQCFVRKLEQLSIPVATGIFRADMQVELVNDGPVTLLLDSRRVF
jgi:D-tyrosyl-tRNA(Tyr) deacylase